MSDLKIGDSILSDCNGEVCETQVKLWLRRAPYRHVTYLRLATVNGSLTVSLKHLVANLDEMTSDVYGNMFFLHADEFESDDGLLTMNVRGSFFNELISIQKVMATGAYTPFTETGTFFVSDNENGPFYLAHSFALIDYYPWMVSFFTRMSMQ